MSRDWSFFDAPSGGLEEGVTGLPFELRVLTPVEAITGIPFTELTLTLEKSSVPTA
jgi:hypothetical protein